MTEKKQKVPIELAIEELQKRGGHISQDKISRTIVISASDGGTTKTFHFEARALYSCEHCDDDLYAEFETPAPPPESKLTVKKIEKTLATAADRGGYVVPNAFVGLQNGRLWYAFASSWPRVRSEFSSDAG